MVLSTPVNLQKLPFSLSPNSKILTIGSCFSDNIGNKLKGHLFDCDVNPFGTIFNPISMTKALLRATRLDFIQPSEIQGMDEHFFHFDYHSKFNALSPQSVLESINIAIKSTHENLKDVDLLILTFGTSIAYTRKENNVLVSNCHKVPQKHFTRTNLEVSEMRSEIMKFINLFKTINPSCQILTTVSPVRHTKEGMIDNNRSKSRLLLLCEQLESDGLFYFPSYEIVMDELRDYRFYADDLIHLSSLGTNLIWTKFRTVLMDEESENFIGEIEKLKAAKAHRPFNENSNAHQKFLTAQLGKVRQLSEQYPSKDFSTYLQYFIV